MLIALGRIVDAKYKQHLLNKVDCFWLIKLYRFQQKYLVPKTFVETVLKDSAKLEVL